MCGIAGILRSQALRDSDKETLSRMLEKMRFRGPDDTGTLFKDNIALGMVRLAIIGPDNGKQPIIDPKTNNAVVCNGELYNYIELRDELHNLGYVFLTDSDTEVILHGYHAWGIDRLLQKITGMYAFCIWDEEKGILKLARDRFGIKPLFYTYKNNDFFFSSNLLSLLEASEIDRKVNHKMLMQYFATGYPIGPSTFISDVKQVPPAHVLTLTKGAQLKSEQYWDITYSNELSELSEESVISEIDYLLKNTVKLHMRSDVPIGLLLSSGIDSALLLSYMRELSSKPIQTFTLNFTDPHFGEGVYAQEIAALYETNHYQLDLNKPTPNEIEEVFSFHDQPTFDYSCIPTYFISKFARKHVKVVLMGDGGDELFAGYPTSYLHRLSQRWKLIPKIIRKSLIEPAIYSLPTSFGLIPIDYKLKRFIRGADLTFERGHFSWKLLFDRLQRQFFVNSKILESEKEYDPFTSFEQHFRSSRTYTKTDQTLYLDLKTFMVDDLLVKADRMTMAASLEARVPFLEHQLATFSGKLGEKHKLPGFSTKPLLRKLASKKLPPKILKLKKRGFTPPFAKWLLEDIGNYSRDRILDSYMCRELLQREGVENIINTHRLRKVDYNREIASLLSLSIWYDNNLK